MLTSQHLALTLTCVLVLAGATAGFDPLLLACTLTGAAVGTILPDIHMKRPGRTRPLTVAWYIVQFGRHCCTPVICRLYRRVWDIRVRPDDKLLTHSLPGTLLYLVILAAITAGAAIASCGIIPFPAALEFLGGIILGMLFHIVEDACTRKGISVFFPFSSAVIHGSIRPCNAEDPRIRRFHIQHIAVFAGILALQVYFALPEYYALTASVLGIIVCTGAMVCQSEIRIDSKRELPSAAGEAVSV